MTKKELIEKIGSLLKMDDNLDFLLTLKHEELERLLAFIRQRLERVENP